jgi:hypothetical protein
VGKPCHSAWPASGPRHDQHESPTAPLIWYADGGVPRSGVSATGATSGRVVCSTEGEGLCVSFNHLSWR